MCSNVFNELALSVDVAKEGVQAAANFFQAKVNFPLRYVVPKTTYWL